MTFELTNSLSAVIKCKTFFEKNQEIKKCQQRFSSLCNWGKNARYLSKE